ncbi:hypothetical protein BOTNAR_1599g00020 [Botryotinia narcissicola]|uniref:Uncharacterized protein n=1 Tax=Botryotinia narcissicola TaxID=278944 RepID=A0A4Z1H3Q6_9HELO|nr:hypothetical protein BOTNAR_1599g00020 [Botryotinia narcissicola]
MDRGGIGGSARLDGRDGRGEGDGGAGVEIGGAVAGVDVTDINDDVDDKDDKAHDDKFTDTEGAALTVVPVPVSSAEEEITLAFPILVVQTLLDVSTGVTVQIPVELPPLLTAPEGEPEGNGVVVQVADTDMGLVDGKGVKVEESFSITVIHSVRVQLSVTVTMLVGSAEQRVSYVLSMMRVAESVDDGEGEIDVPSTMGVAERIGSVTVEIIETVVERAPPPEIKTFVAEELPIDELETDVEKEVPETVRNNVQFSRSVEEPPKRH